jgi:hypothetical protein
MESRKYILKALFDMILALALGFSLLEKFVFLIWGLAFSIINLHASDKS